MLVQETKTVFPFGGYTQYGQRHFAVPFFDVVNAFVA